MTYLGKLISFHIIEKDNTRNFLTWTYPTITDEHKNYILQQCFLRNDESGYFCRRCGNVWFHINEEKSYAVVILSKEFQPKKYKVLCDILAKKYSENYNPVDLVSLYLDLFTKGSSSLCENGALKIFESDTNLKGFIQTFDLEIILLYTAILLKRRVLLFNSNIGTLLNDLLALSNLVPSRKVEDYLYPIIENPNKLKGLSFFVAGTTDRDLIKYENSYDLFVNMETGEIAISPKAEEIMAMTKTHKEIATFLVKLSSGDASEAEMKRQILQKGEDLISLLQNIASVTTQTKKMVTMTDLKSKKFHPNMENFLFNLAIAENVMIL